MVKYLKAASWIDLQDSFGFNLLPEVYGQCFVAKYKATYRSSCPCESDIQHGYRGHTDNIRTLMAFLFRG